MEIVPQIKVLFVLTKTDSNAFAWDVVSKRLGLTPAMAEGPRLSKGKMNNLSTEDLKGITVLAAPEPPYSFVIHATWSFELPKVNSWDVAEAIQKMEHVLAGKEQEVQSICKEFDLVGELIVRVYAESGNTPVCTLSAESISFWNKIGAAVTFDFCL